jgi:hypothetical protein
LCDDKSLFRSFGEPFHSFGHIFRNDIAFSVCIPEAELGIDLSLLSSESVSTLQSAVIVLPTTDGREIRLRRITEPTMEQKSLLRQLGICLPEHLRSQHEYSTDSAVASTDSEPLGPSSTWFVTNLG